MAGSYDVSSYLLDRFNINDSLARMYFAIDTHKFDSLLEDVYAPDLVMDYTSLMGGEPSQVSARDWVEGLKGMMGNLDSTSHVISSIVAELPQPGRAGAVRPDTCEVLANGGAHMVRHGAKGGPIIHNGGVAYFTMVRIKELEEQGKNPWRISKMRYDVAWQEGSPDVTKF